MHTCAPPSQALNAWLAGLYVHANRFGHLLLEANAPHTQILVDALRPYFESAHLDAREVFHEDAGLDLHPDATGPVSPIQYPGCLPPITLRGLFGEVMLGLVSEAYPAIIVGQHAWKVPVFLFRFHEDAADYFYDLQQNPNRIRQVIGRHGDDFIGLCLDAEGFVIRFIAGEAKWRETIQPSVVNNLLLGNLLPNQPNSAVRTRANDGIWNDLNTASNPPRGLRQMQRILEERTNGDYQNAIISIDRAITQRNPIPRTNLVLIAGEAAPTRAPHSCLMPVQIPPEYTSNDDLQLVEIVLRPGDDQMIDLLYQSLWT